MASLEVLGLTPNEDYIITVFATWQDASGQVHISDVSPPLQISTPSYSGSGGNLTTTNSGTDIQLNGGSLFAGTFPSGTGLIDVVNDEVNGTGVIVNQSGVAGFNSGTKEFYLDAVNGTAYFAGNLSGDTTIGGNGITLPPASFTATGNTTGSSTLVTLSNITPSTAILIAGMPVSGTGVPTNAYVVSTPTTTSVVLNTPVTLSSVTLTFTTPTAKSIIAAASAGVTRNQSFTASTQPTATNIGDIWYDTSNGYKAYRWNGTTWQSVQDTAIQSAYDASQTASNNATAAQASADGKNNVIYGAAGSNSYSGQAPDGNTYTVQQGQAGGTPTGSDTFPSTTTSNSKQTVGDTWFVRNNTWSIIAQYTATSVVSGSTGPTTWTRSTVSSQVIGNLDAGKITTGVISAVQYQNSTGTFLIDIYGNLTTTASVTVGSGSNKLQLSSGNLSVTGAITATSFALSSASSSGDYWTVSANGGSTFQFGGSQGITNSSGYVTLGGTSGWQVGLGVLASSGTYLYSDAASTTWALLTGKRVSAGGFESGSQTSNLYGTSVTNPGTPNAFTNGWIVGGTLVPGNGYDGHASDSAFSIGNATYKWNYIYSAHSAIQTSDLRTKNDIQPAVLGLNFINALKPVSFKMNVGNVLNTKNEDGTHTNTQIPGKRRHYGFIAQDVQETIKSLGLDPSVDFAGWTLDNPSDSESRQGLVYDYFVAPLVAAVQELSNKIDILQSEFDSLKK